ncbi:hypothetical protein L7F22_066262 [Adiantum nelumboides]|nr:hypothetical protein [Adiantum nelumboides]
MLQVVRPLPGPEGSPDNAPTIAVTPSSTQSNNSTNNNIVPDKALPEGTVYGGKEGPLMPNAPPHAQDSLSNAFHPNIAVIIGVLSTMFSLTFLILLYAKHCKRPPVSVYGAQDTEVINPAPLTHLGPTTFLFVDRDSGLDRAIVQGLPMFSFSALKGMKEGLECAVCLSRYESSEVLRLLPKCKHAFHVDCVDVWLSSHSTCPLCRERVDAEDTLVVEDYLSGFSKLLPHGSEPPSTRQSARISISELTDNYLDRAFELYVQRDAEGADILAGGSSWQYGSGRSSWRKLDAGSERKLGSWRSAANFSGPFGGSERKSELGCARVAPLQIQGSELYFGSQRSGADAEPPNVTAAPGSVPPNVAGTAAGGDRDHCFYIDEELARRLGHRIIVSDVMFQHRWSDFLPADVPFFDTSTVQLRERSILPLSEELAIGAESAEGTKDAEGETGLRAKTGGSGRMTGGARVADAEVEAEKQKKQGAGWGRIKVGGSRLRCMSELSGLQRVHQQKQAEDIEAAAQDGALQNESARRWLATARRTLRWLLGGRSASGPMLSGHQPPLPES